MRAGNILIALFWATVLPVCEQGRSWLQTSPVLWAAQPRLRPREIFRARLESGSEGPEVVVIPAGRFRTGDIQGGGGKDELSVNEAHLRRSFAVGE